MADNYFVKSEPIPSLDDIFSTIPAKALKLDEPPMISSQSNCSTFSSFQDLNYQHQQQPYTVVSNTANFASIIPENMVVISQQNQTNDNFIRVHGYQNIKIDKQISQVSSIVKSEKNENNFPPTAGQAYTVIKPIIATPQNSSTASSQSSGYFTTSPSSSSGSSDLQSFEIQNITDHVTSNTVPMQPSVPQKFVLSQDQNRTILLQDNSNFEDLLCDPKQVLRLTQTTPPPVPIHQPLKLQPTIGQEPKCQASPKVKKSEKAMTHEFLLRKREANRLAAQKCRDKKTKRIKTLEQEVDRLNVQILQLRQNEQRQAELIDQIHSVINSTENEHVSKTDLLELLIS